MRPHGQINTAIGQVVVHSPYALNTIENNPTMSATIPTSAHDSDIVCAVATTTALTYILYKWQTGVKSERECFERLLHKDWQSRSTVEHERQCSITSGHLKQISIYVGGWHNKQDEKALRAHPDIKTSKNKTTSCTAFSHKRSIRNW